MAETYFVALGNDTYQPTELSGGAWRDDELHLAAVAGLVIHHMERFRKTHLGEGLAFSRFSIDVLGQIPRDEISLSTQIVRPGRTIELIETTAVIGERAIIRARAWLLRSSELAGIAGDSFAPIPSMSECVDRTGQWAWSGGFMDSYESAVPPGEAVPGHNQAWVTGRYALVDAETPEPLAEFAKFLDVANGVAPREDPTQWMFPNVDLTFHLFRQPVGIAVGFDTRVAFGPTGVGLTTSVIFDETGPVGTLNQSLTVRPIAEL